MDDVMQAMCNTKKAKLNTGGNVLHIRWFSVHDKVSFIIIIIIINCGLNAH